MVVSARTSLSLLWLFGLVKLSCSSPGQGSGLDQAVLKPEVLFASDAKGLDGIDDPGRASALQRMLSDGGDRMMRIMQLLRGLNLMQDPHVGEPVAELVAGIVEGEFDSVVAISSTEELDGLLGWDQEGEPSSFRFLHDMRLLRNAPVMRRYLLRSFYRAVARLGDYARQRRVFGGHLKSVPSKCESEKREALRIILCCMIPEAARSPTLLRAFCMGLYGHGLNVLDDPVDDFERLLFNGPDMFLYGKIVEMYVELEPLASEAMLLQASIDWRQVFLKYQVVSGFHSLPPGLVKHFGLSLPIDDDDPYLKGIFESADIGGLISSATFFIFEKLWHNQGGVLADIRPGVKRWVNFFWRKGERTWAQTFAVAVCWLYDMDEWESEAGWKAQRKLDCGPNGMTGTDQVTWFHRLPREILLRIGPVMPVLVSKATYQLGELRASYSNLSYFTGRVLRPLDTDDILRLWDLQDGWAIGLSAGEIVKARQIVASSDLPWVGRLQSVAKIEEAAHVTAARQGRITRSPIDRQLIPMDSVAFLAFSLAFGMAPFEFSDSDERLALMLMVRSQYPLFVSLVQALESLTRGGAKDKEARVPALIRAFRGSGLPQRLFHEWLFTRYLSETELFEMIGTCDETSLFFKTVTEVCGTRHSYLVPLGALKRCARIVRRGLLKGEIEKTKIRAMAVRLGAPEPLVDGVLEGDRDALTAVLPGSVTRIESWLDVVPIESLSNSWFFLLNLSDDMVIDVLRDERVAGAGVESLSRYLSAAAKDRIIAECARRPSSFSKKVVETVLEAQAYVDDGWEPERVVFDKGPFGDEQYRRSVGLDGRGICGRLVEHSKTFPRGSRGRFHNVLFANLKPETRRSARAEYYRTRRCHDALNIVLAMLLNGRTVRSIGKNLCLLLEGDVGELETLLSEAPIKKEYIDRINVAVADFAKGPGKVMEASAGEHAQQRRFIENFDYAAAEKSLSLAATAFKAILKSLAVPESDDDQRTFGLRISYADAKIEGCITVSMKHAPVYMIKEIFKVVREPFELEVDERHLEAAGTIGALKLPDAITVRVLTSPRDIVGQLRILFKLVKRNIQQQ